MSSAIALLFTVIRRYGLFTAAVRWQIVTLLGLLLVVILSELLLASTVVSDSANVANVNPEASNPAASKVFMKIPL
jgi:hypothetical protein